MELKKIGILSLGKIAGIFGAIAGLLLGLLSMLYSRVLLNSAPELAEQFQITGTVGIGAVLVSIIVYGIVYFLAGIIFAALYNLIARKFGGIELQFKGKK